MRLLSPPHLDLYGPSVNVYSPGNGATVANTITIAASSSDNYGVVGIQYQWDGANIGGEVGPGGSVGLDTHFYGNGWHTITAIARDARGYQATHSISVYVSNSAPGAGWLNWGNLMQWWEDEEFTGWTSYRSGCVSYDNRWNGSLHNAGASWWDAVGEGAGAYPTLWLPGNPNPTYYQMRFQMHWSRLEGGSDHNHVYLAFVLGGGEYVFFDNGSTYDGWAGPWNVNGGEGLQLLRWAIDGGWNSSFTQGLGAYYDFVPKYAS